MADTFIIDPKTLEIERFTSAYAAAAKIGGCDARIRKAAANTSYIRANGKTLYVFRSNKVPDIAEIIWRKPKARGVKVTKLGTGTTGYFASVGDAAEKLHIGKTPILENIKGVVPWFGERTLQARLIAEYVDYEHVNHCKLCERCRCRSKKACIGNQTCVVRTEFARKIEES